MVKEVSSDPPKCILTYVTRGDLKGKRFSFLTHRLAAENFYLGH